MIFRLFLVEVNKFTNGVPADDVYKRCVFASVMDCFGAVSKRGFSRQAIFTLVMAFPLADG